MATKEESDRYWAEPHELPEDEQLYLDLWFKRKEPSNEAERRMLKEMQEIHEKYGNINVQFDPF